jgi:hypothetical protein
VNRIDARFHLHAYGLDGSAAEQTARAQSRDNDASDEQPDGLVGGCAGEEAGKIRTNRIRGVDTVHDENDAGDEQSEGDEFVHGISLEERSIRSVRPGEPVAPST